MDGMKQVVIRTLTCFISVPTKHRRGSLLLRSSTRPVVHFEQLEAAMRNAKNQLTTLKLQLGQQGYEVQTLRLCLDSFPQYATAATDVADLLKIEQVAKSLGIDFLSIGKLNADHEDFDAMLSRMSKVIRQSTILNMSVELGETIDHERCRGIAKVIIDIANHDVLNNFRFCATSLTPSGIPFFPTSHHDGTLDGFIGVGLESGPLLESVLLNPEVNTYKQAGDMLRDLYAATLLPIQDTCELFCLSSKEQSSFLGIDASMNPSVQPLHPGGMGGAYSAFLNRVEGLVGDEQSLRTIGDAGTLALSYTITSAIQAAKTAGKLKLVGYSGLMLPQLEDPGLASAATRGKLSVSQFLQQSAVCGVGVDTVAIPGSVTPDRLASLLVDVHALSLRWNKPLSCRVFPCPGKEAGDETEFNSPYLCNSAVLALD